MDILVPTELNTERLLLRQFKDEDWRDLHQHYSDAEATKYTYGKSLSEGETWRTMCGMLGHWQIRGYGPYAVMEKSSNAVLGAVGFWYPNDWPSPEIKWALSKPYWGNGFASEATRAVQAAGLKYLPNIALISLIHKSNLASIKLAESVGAGLEKEVEFRGNTWNMHRHPRAI